MPNKIAFAHPGRMGDVLYCLPTIKYICEKENCKADFWTSEYCLPLKELFEYQSYIDKFYISPSYVLDNWGCGGQPWYVPIPNDEYIRTYQLGFRKTPDTRLDHFIAKQVGVDPNLLPKVNYQYPDDYISLDLERYDIEEYYLLAPRGITSFYNTFLDFIRISDLPVLQVGGSSDFICGDRIKPPMTYDYTGVSFFDTTKLFSDLSGCRGFVGLMSSQLVLANGFYIPKVAVHDGRSWDMRHVVYSESNYYPINPSAEEILNIIQEHNYVRS